ncbi:tRNA (guanine-N(7)-)-methyltransferase non-catalytic subunit trm82 [Exophiala xenobiotica]
MSRGPFQTLCCVQPVDGQQPFLLAARGPVISSFNLKDGSLLDQWPRLKGANTQDGDAGMMNGDDGPPAKRRRMEDDGPAQALREDTEESIEIISERKKGERQKPKVENSKLPNVTHVVVTSTAATVITVTAEDKSINVFSVGNAGVLNLQSQRSMPKRICAIVLTPDEKNILVGDKFGDVYLLPLHPSGDWVPRTLDKDGQDTLYTPSATELTVHTKGNLEALKQQRERKISQPTKEGPNFELKLLLGHVSLLTDVAIAEVQDGLKRKQYILTADRDEHIRISRGISQAHIIEGYCLGHREFVTKLCIPPWDAEFLVAGSGEPSLKVYHWRTGRLIDEELFTGDVRQDISRVLDLNAGERSLDRLAVSNIWPIHYTVGGKSPYSRHPPHLLLVAIEGLPILLSYSLADQGQLRHHQTVVLGGNALDVAIGPALWEIVVSVDTVHKPGSVKDVRPEATPESSFFETFELFSDASEATNGEAQPQEGRESALRWERSSLAMLLNNAVPGIESVELAQGDPSHSNSTNSALGEQLYSLENLRKRKGQPALDAVDEDPEESTPAPA